MGYTTDFSGRFELNKPLSEKMYNYLKLFNQTRRMKRNVDAAFGIEGEFFVFGAGFMGQDNDATVIDGNQQPSTQCGLWCQWMPSEDRMGIEWDEGEKFYSYTEWLVYLIHKFLAPNGYVLNGVVQWQGEENGDVGEIFVEDNRVFTQEWKGRKTEMTPQSVKVYSYPSGYVDNFMRTDIVLLIDNVDDLLLTESIKQLE